jgi:hypothetical protein
MQRLHLVGAASIAALLALHPPTRAEDVLTFRLTLKGHVTVCSKLLRK